MLILHFNDAFMRKKHKSGLGKQIEQLFLERGGGADRDQLVPRHQAKELCLFQKFLLCALTGWEHVDRENIHINTKFNLKIIDNEDGMKHNRRIT